MNPPSPTLSARCVISAFEKEFADIRRGAEQAIAQLDADLLRHQPDPGSNSIALIMKHVAGNLRSRFVDFLTTDGEKPWRARDGEFIDDFPSGEPGRIAIMAAWNDGWSVLISALAALEDADLPRMVCIRGQPLTVAQALARSLAHIGYHHGQIVVQARTLVGVERWKTISIPRGGSQAFNRSIGYEGSPSQRAEPS